MTLDTSADSDNNLSVTVDTVINNAGKTQVISTLSGVDSDAKTVVVTYTDKDGKEVTRQYDLRRTSTNNGKLKRRT